MKKSIALRTGQLELPQINISLLPMHESTIRFLDRLKEFIVKVVSGEVVSSDYSSNSLLFSFKLEVPTSHPCWNNNSSKTVENLDKILPDLEKMVFRKIQAGNSPLKNFIKMQQVGTIYNPEMPGDQSFLVSVAFMDAFSQKLIDMIRSLSKVDQTSLARTEFLRGVLPASPP